MPFECETVTLQCLAAYLPLVTVPVASCGETKQHRLLPSIPGQATGVTSLNPRALPEGFVGLLEATQRGGAPTTKSQPRVMAPPGGPECDGLPCSVGVYFTCDCVCMVRVCVGRFFWGIGWYDDLSTPYACARQRRVSDPRHIPVAPLNTYTFLKEYVWLHLRNIIWTCIWSIFWL